MVLAYETFERTSEEAEPLKPGKRWWQAGTPPVWKDTSAHDNALNWLNAGGMKLEDVIISVDCHGQYTRRTRVTVWYRVEE